MAGSSFMVDKLRVKRFETRAELGADAAKDAAECLRVLLSEKPEVNVIFAAAPSQNEFLAALCEEDVDFSRINAFHMDEYLDLKADAPQRFGNFLRRAIFDKKNFKSVHYLDAEAADPEAECARYSALLEAFPTDVVCLGIGENGHIAFNDPPVADFVDPKAVKVVALDNKCRRQQVNDGCFSTLSEVPRRALTLTIPSLLRGNYLFCVVPAAAKAEAVSQALKGPVSERCPASILRTHDHVNLYIDADSGSLL